jgi:hypothetical protein
VLQRLLLPLLGPLRLSSFVGYLFTYFGPREGFQELVTETESGAESRSAPDSSVSGNIDARPGLSQRGVHPASRSVTHIGQDVGVGIQGEAYISVAQELLDKFGIYALP